MGYCTLVGSERFELTCLSASDFKSDVSTNSTTSPSSFSYKVLSRRDFTFKAEVVQE